MTTENVALLFTDMVGSTALASGLSPDAADELRRGHFSILRQALAEAGGTEVKNLGDGLMVAFASTSAALSCAVAIQQGVERDSRGREHSVGLRVGLSGGEVTSEDYDYFGDPVIEAARLCATCEGGQILAADVVRAMAGRRSRHECNPVGPVTRPGESSDASPTSVSSGITTPRRREATSSVLGETARLVEIGTEFVVSMSVRGRQVAGAPVAKEKRP